MKERHTICYPIRPHGKFIEVKGTTMCVLVEGNGDEVIVFLSGAASPSSIIETEALRNFLKEKYIIVVLEYLGYGLSNAPKTERTLDNITDEIHEALNILGFSKYSIVAHSISGVYSLQYANKYTNEIKAVIGIESSVPRQAEDKKTIDRIITYAEHSYVHRESKFLWWITDHAARRRLRTSNDYIYNKKDVKVYGLLAATMLGAECILSEYKNIISNFRKIRNMKFPPHIPVLFILAKESQRKCNEWCEMHRQLLGENNGRIIIINGGHYLYITQPKIVSKEIDNFLSETVFKISGTAGVLIK